MRMLITTIRLEKYDRPALNSRSINGLQKLYYNLAPYNLPIFHVFGTLRVRLGHKGLNQYICSLFTKNKVFEKKL